MSKRVRPKFRQGEKVKVYVRGLPHAKIDSFISNGCGLGTYCTVCEAIEQAQAEALKIAARKCDLLYSKKDAEFIAGEILALTPRRVQIEAEFRELKAKLSEANAWASHATRYDRKIWATDRIALLNTEIATLERELEAERKGV